MRYLSCFFVAVSLLLSACTTTTVYIVRHAEKVAETDSTDLSPLGFARAAALADTLANKGIDSIFTTPYRRTRQTAQPLATRLSEPIVYYPTTAAIISRINRVRGKQMLVVGHSNTILEIARGLGATPVRTTIESGDFDNLLRVRITRHFARRSVSISETTYGRPTPP